MKKKAIVDGYNAVKDISLSKMDSADQFIVIKALRVLKPIATTYDEEIKSVENKVTSCTPEELKANRELASQHNEAERNKDPEKMLSAKKIAELNKFFTKVGEEVQGLVNELNDEKVELTYDKLSEESFKKLLESNPDTTAEAKLAAYDLFVG